MPTKILKKLLLVLALTIFCFALSVTANTTDSNGLTYTAYEDGVMVTSCTSNAKGHLIIPAEYQGQKVVKINDDAFINRTKLTSVIIPDTVREIGDSAFAGCTSLAEIVFSDNLEAIGTDAFFACDALETVLLPNSLKSIAPFAFFDCANLKLVVIPEQIELIPEGTFENCCKLTTISLPYSLKTVDYNAFKNCNNIKTVYYNHMSVIAYSGIDWTEGNSALYSPYPSYYESTHHFSHPHENNTITVAKAPDCTESGVSYNTCVCGYIFSKFTTKPLGHNVVTSPEIKATCQDAGITAGTACSRCDVIFSGCKTIPATGHTAIAYPAKNPTCTSEGNTAGTICRDCGKTLSGCEAIAKAEHSWTLNSYKAPDCTTGTKGYRTDICLVCKTVTTVYEDEIHPYDNWKIIKQPTCSETGLKNRVCTVNGCEAYEEAVIAKLPHTLVYSQETQPTCTDPGYIPPVVCRVCKTIVTEDKTIPAKGHTLVTAAEIPATCYTSGITQYTYCRECNYYVSKPQETPALNHEYGDWKITKEPSCESEGLMAKSCKLCGLLLQEYKIAATDHNYSSYTVILQPSCIDTGLAVSICTVCDNMKSEVIAALGHKDINNDGVCDLCSENTAGTEECPCNCHKTGIKALFFRIVNFFQKLFGNNLICDCGAEH